MELNEDQDHEAVENKPDAPERDENMASVESEIKQEIGQARVAMSRMAQITMAASRSQRATVARLDTVEGSFADVETALKRIAESTENIERRMQSLELQHVPQDEERPSHVPPQESRNVVATPVTVTSRRGPASSGDPRDHTTYTYTEWPTLPPGTGAPRNLPPRLYIQDRVTWQAWLALFLAAGGAGTIFVGPVMGVLGCLAVVASTIFGFLAIRNWHTAATHFMKLRHMLGSPCAMCSSYACFAPAGSAALSCVAFVMAAFLYDIWPVFNASFGGLAMLFLLLSFLLMRAHANVAHMGVPGTIA